MSVYTEYDTLSSEYDCARRPQGADIYLGLVYSLTKKTAENLHLLDLGCGTGNHVKFLMEEGLQQATLIDASAGMVAQASKKLAKFINEGRVKIEQHKLPKIPYEDNSFDVVMSNQVLHHLTDLKTDKDFTSVRELIKETFRVLKPNGVFLVNLCTPFQCHKGFWYGDLFPMGNDAFAHRVIEQKRFLTMLTSAGFVREGMVVKPLEMVYEEKWYFNKEGPLDPVWRKADSLTATASQEDVKHAEKVLNEKKERGTLDQYFTEADNLREHVGQFAIYYGKKCG